MIGYLIVGMMLILPAYESNTYPTRINKQGIELLGVTSLPGTATDMSGLNNSLDATSTNNMLGGFSAIAWTGNENLYYFLSDRGPNDGAVDWTCRFQTFRISYDPESPQPVSLQFVDTTLLRNVSGIPFTGRASAYWPGNWTTGRLDPEGIRVGSNGNLYISDEYGPQLIEFLPDGQEVRRLSMPIRYLIANPGLDKKQENTTNYYGRQCNRGMEGLAISPDNLSLFGLMQSPLLQDSDRVSTPEKPLGLNCRMMRFGSDGNVDLEWLYHLDQSANKLNEVLYCTRSTFAVIERDGEAGELAQFKKVMLVSTARADNIQRIDRLPVNEIPTGIQPMVKNVLIDLLDPVWGLAGQQMPEKIESLAFGPDLPDGRKMLVVGSDNDFVRDSDSLVYVFAVPKKSLTDWTVDHSNQTTGIRDTD